MSNESQELQDLTNEVLVLQELNHNLAQRLELKENEIVLIYIFKLPRLIRFQREMGEFIGELTSQSNEKSDAIARATKVIESLRDEVYEESSNKFTLFNSCKKREMILKIWNWKNTN